MKNILQSLAFTLTAFCILVVGNTFAQESEQGKSPKTHATYDAADLKRNLGSTKLRINADSKERASFIAAIDKDGQIQDLTYSHNITIARPEFVDAQIQRAYMAIMSTTFYPAHENGNTLADTITINLELVN
jgi:hypothetical protein